ncbi:MAG: biliverdin-producing heme oxygenase [Archangium sp.]
MGESTPTVREALKSSTAHAHRSLEAAMNLTGANATRARYVKYLQTLTSVHEALEPRLLGDAELQALLTDLPSRARTEAGKHDLASLGEERSRTHFTATLPMTTVAEKLGVLYVLEGSTLGGQVLRRELKSALGVGDESLRYVSGYGELTGPKWKSFLEALERGVTTDEARRQAISAAQATFEQLQAFFEAHEVRKS